MNQMFRDLDDMQKHITQNWDLGAMENMMGATKDIIGTHTKAFDGLKQSVEAIHKMAK